MGRDLLSSGTAMNMETRAAWKSQVLVLSCCRMKLQDTREKLNK